MLFEVTVMKVCSLLAVLVMILSILACGFMLLESKSLAMQLADKSASLRLLSKFHQRFNNEVGVSADKYRQAVASFASDNPDLTGIQWYSEFLGEAEQQKE